MSNYVSDSGHWYDKDGEPKYTVLDAKGNERNTSLADARKLGLVPSVTNVLGLQAKPQLTKWLQNQVLEASLNVFRERDEPLDEYKKRVMEYADQYTNERRDEGTAIHSAIDRGFINGELNKYYQNVYELVNTLFPNRRWFPEVSFASHLGYGGKCDLSSDIMLDDTKAHPVIIDYKSKEWVEGDKPKKFIYDDHGMQLSAYGYGLFECENPIRINIFVRPSDGKCIFYQHEENNDLEKFKTLLKFWQLLKNYDSSFKE